MAYTQAQNKATQKYQKKAYDVITFRVKKGEREKIQQYAESKQTSVNALLTQLLENEMAKE